MAGERALPGLGLMGFWTLGSNGWKDQNDQNLLKLSVMVQASVKDFVPFLPGSPANGDIYILDAGAGADAHKIGVRDNGAWTLLTPKAGWVSWVEDEAKFYAFDGSVWVLNDLSAKQDLTERGAVNGYASLNSAGQVPASQLPGSADVEEYANLAAFPGTGEVGTVYIALDTDTSYIWDDDGSVYIAMTSTGTLPSTVGFKAPCRRVATTNVNIATGGIVTIDGGNTVNKDRILLVGQTLPAENGIYICNSTGAWTRAADANVISEIRGALVTVWQGTTYGSSVWFTTFKHGNTLGTTAMNWYEVAHGENIIDLINALLGSTTWQSGGGGGGATAFTGLSDVPASYSGQALKLVRVNAAGTALEFVTNTNPPAFNVDDKTASYSTVSADFAGNKLIRMNVASANTFTVDPSMANGEAVAVTQMGVGQTTITAGAGVTLQSAGGALKLRAQHSVCTIMKVGTNTYLVSGDLTT